MLVDAISARRMGTHTRDELRQAGCRFSLFHRWSLKNIGVLSDRDHRKLTVIDGTLAFVGGHCITDHWLGKAQDAEHFADLSIEVRDPAVHNIQATFSENWVAATGELFGGGHIFPVLAAAGALAVHVVYAKPEGAAPAVKVLHSTRS